MPSSFSPPTVLFVLAALIAGALVPFQAGSNAALGRALGNPLWATVVSLLVSLLVVLPVMLAMRAPAPHLGQASHLPWWAWLGGVAGVIYITSALLLTPRMGAASFIVCVIAGQMLTSLLIDHFGLVGLPLKEVNWGRMGGVALIFVGMCWCSGLRQLPIREKAAMNRTVRVVSLVLIVALAAARATSEKCEAVFG